MALEELFRSCFFDLLPAETSKREQAEAKARGQQAGRFRNRRDRIEIDRLLLRTSG
jgi:hypothetical protein